MTLITITTAGYEEVNLLDTGGRVFTVVIILIGVGTAYFVSAAVTAVVVGSQFREFVGKSVINRKIQQLEDRVILCGYGRFGRIVAKGLKNDDHTLMVIEINPALESEPLRSGLNYIVGVKV
jgi:voltage-gated potassium channel